MNEPFHRYRLFPDYKANRRGGPVVRKRAPRVERRSLEAPNPELRFFFILPDDLAFAVAPGPTGVIGVQVGVGRTVTATGHGRDWVLAQAAGFLRAVAPPGFWTRRPIAGILECPPHPGPTLSGPLNPGYSESLSLEIVSGDPVVVISKSALRPLIFGPGSAKRASA